jgi:hypothetical protein
MSDSKREETRDLWNRVADDWLIQVGDDGDGNRLLNSDPISGSPCLSFSLISLSIFSLPKSGP